MDTNETEREARRDLYAKLQALEGAEKEQSKTHAALAEALEAANAADKKLAEKRANWQDALSLYQTASTAIPDDLSTME